jgi:hypothetical protein
MNAREPIKRVSPGANRGSFVLCRGVGLYRVAEASSREEVVVLTFKFLHIVLMFSAVTLFIGGEVIFAGVARSGDVRAMKRVGAVTRKADSVGLASLVLGVGAGFLTATTGHFDLTARWLIIAYVLVGIIFAVGLFVFTPRFERIMKAAEASPDDAPSPELARLLDPRTERLVMVVDVALWASMIFIMVRKPFA